MIITEPKTSKLNNTINDTIENIHIDIKDVILYFKNVKYKFNILKVNDALSKSVFPNKYNIKIYITKDMKFYIKQYDFAYLFLEIKLGFFENKFIKKFFSDEISESEFEKELNKLITTRIKKKLVNLKSDYVVKNSNLLTKHPYLIDIIDIEEFISIVNKNPELVFPKKMIEKISHKINGYEVYIFNEFIYKKIISKKYLNIFNFYGKVNINVLDSMKELSDDALYELKDTVFNVIESSDLHFNSQEYVILYLLLRKGITNIKEIENREMKTIRTDLKILSNFCSIMKYDDLYVDVSQEYVLRERVYLLKDKFIYNLKKISFMLNIHYKDDMSNIQNLENIDRLFDLLFKFKKIYIRNFINVYYRENDNDDFFINFIQDLKNKLLELVPIYTKLYNISEDELKNKINNNIKFITSEEIDKMNNFI